MVRAICRSVWLRHVARGANQYAPMTGVQALRDAIAIKRRNAMAINRMPTATLR